MFDAKHLNCFLTLVYKICRNIGHIFNTLKIRWLVQISAESLHFEHFEDDANYGTAAIVNTSQNFIQSPLKKYLRLKKKLSKRQR